MLIAHLTDPHIGLTSTPECPPLDPEAALKRALIHVRQTRPTVDVVIISGDLAEAGQAESYETIAHLLRTELPSPEQGGPMVLLTPGNHDDPRLVRQILAPWIPVAPDAPKNCSCLHVTHQGLHLIGLDTVVKRCPHGELGPLQLAWLEAKLQACADEPVMIFMHHPPLITGMSVMDQFGLLKGREEMAALVERHGKVRLIAAGHQHRPITGILGGAHVVVAPSTSHQLHLDLRPDAPLAISTEPPMIGLYRWIPEYGMACHLSHVTAYDGPYICPPTTRPGSPPAAPH